MSPLPGYEVNIIDTAPNPGELGDIATAFILGTAETPGFGLVYSIDQFETVFGERQAESPLWDGVEVFFREGGLRAYVSAADIGAATPEVAGACDAFLPDYGPGAMLAPGLTDPEIYTALMDHSQYSRIALLDAPDSAVVADLTAAAVDAQTGAQASGERFAGMFAPWDVAPGIVSGTTRTVPPSARVAGNLARNDALGYSAGDPASGVLGIARYVQDLSQANWSDGDRTTLNSSCVNVSRRILGGVRTYGWRSLADQEADYNWTMFNSARIVMAIKYDLGVMAENFVFSKLSGMATATKKFGGAVALILEDYYTSGDLYGDTSDEAYVVDTGPAVNTPDSFAAGQLMANVGLRAAGMAEQVVINVAKIPITETVTAS